jgi:hypothetical protein
MQPKTSEVNYAIDQVDLIDTFFSSVCGTLPTIDHILDHKIDLNLFFFVVLKFELRAYTLSNSTSPFLGKDVFEVGSQKLFALAGFYLQSS